MTRTPSLICTTAAMVLTFGMAVAADKAEAEQTQPAVTAHPDNQSKPEEKTTDTPPPQTKTAITDKEPECE
jgi:hypothetical protein